jgi:peptide/nickel transport system substrate-binding protein
MSRAWGLLVGAVAASGMALSAEAQSVLKFVPQANLGVMDNLVNSSSIVHQHSYMIYDNLFAVDADFAPKPQMVESWNVSADGLTYTFKLRAGLKFHDGTPVASKDVAASVARWAVRDSVGQQLRARGLEAAAVDDVTFTLKLREKSGLVIDALAKPSASALFIRREAEAKTEPTVPIPDTIGSGPFRFVRDAYVPGSKVVYEKSPDYRPRPEPASGYAGGRVAKVARVEWTFIPDANSAVAALTQGEVDYYETPPIDFLPQLKRNPAIVVKAHSTSGAMGLIRPNFLHPPFNTEKGRQALAHAVNQEDYMRVAAGSDPANWRACWAWLVCGTPAASEAGAEKYKTKDIAKAKQLLAEAGYKNEPVVVLLAADNQIIRSLTEVTIANLREIGLNVDVQQMDLAAVFARRFKREPPAEGGWSMFHTWGFGYELGSATTNIVLNSPCDGTGYAGFACDEEMQKLRVEWSAEGDFEKRKAIGERIQRRAAEFVHYVPVGQFFQPVAYRASLAGVLPVPIPVLWNIEKK